MPGVVFLISIPTSNYERELENVNNQQNIIESNENDLVQANLNIPENSKPKIRMEIELRDKNIRTRRFPQQQQQQQNYGKLKQNIRNGQQIHKTNMTVNYNLPMEKVLDELLKKLNIENVTWTCDKNGHFFHVIFPIQSGDPCETTLHCLTELGIGSKLHSTISVLPCTVSYESTKENTIEELYRDPLEESKWNNFIESIKSKLTVKQVVDGVRAGGSLSFDYLLLIVTADSLAALGLVENNAPNIVAAMLVSPLMGPVMSITFGAIISDRELMRVGFMSLGLGIFISILFGFIFGLILGTTEMPWGFGDWPTEEMKGRGNVRSLWMGVLWALTSGTGVAVALLQGSAGPLIGVAISASLLPPVVNCGLFWALACIWLIYDGIKMPHLKGEAYTGNSSYVPIYTNYIPTEFLINGIVSAMLTVVNVICIFITAIIVLKIKEVAAPYTASPDLRRFWETDIRTVRKTNRSTIRKKDTEENIAQFKKLSSDPKNKNLESALEQALKEAVDDETLRKVKRMSYSSNAVDEVTRGLAIPHLNTNPSSSRGSGSSYDPVIAQNIKLKADLKTLDKLINTILDNSLNDSNETHHNEPILTRFRQKSRSLRMHGSIKSPNDSTMPTISESPQRTINRSSWIEKNIPSARRVLTSISNAPNRLSQTISNVTFNRNDGEENVNLANSNNLD